MLMKSPLLLAWSMRSARARPSAPMIQNMNLLRDGNACRFENSDTSRKPYWGDLQRRRHFFIRYRTVDDAPQDNQHRAFHKVLPRLDGLAQTCDEPICLRPLL